MNLLFGWIHILLPFFGAVLLIMGVKNRQTNYLIASLWLSLIAILLHYQTAGGELLGSYFCYKNALLYSFNLIILIVSLVCLFFKVPFLHQTLIRYLTGFISAGLVVVGIIFLVNLWVNAFFIENRSENSPIMQVATFKPLDYCQYKYIFYRVDKNGGISYLCPNYYMIIPSTGHLKVSPDFLIRHLSQTRSDKPREQDKK